LDMKRGLEIGIVVIAAKESICNSYGSDTYCSNRAVSCYSSGEETEKVELMVAVRSSVPRRNSFLPYARCVSSSSTSRSSSAATGTASRCPRSVSVGAGVET